MAKNKDTSKKNPKDTPAEELLDAAEEAVETSEDELADAAADEAARAEEKARKAAEKAAKKAEKEAAAKKKEPNKVAKWFKDLRIEFKKVVWPSKETVITNTSVVLAVVVASAVLVGLLDEGFLALMRLIYR
ncbi:MAG: preprotein translocase subunit SecE [Ruminococcus sp.]|nr:preprotein translocase subunit SecE [Ruminococcus sp.]